MRAPRSRLVRSSAAIAVAAFALSACGPSSPSPSPGSRPVSFTVPGGVELEGRVFEAEGASAGSCWRTCNPPTSPRGSSTRRRSPTGYRTLTFNFRGYCPGGDAGCSGGETDLAVLWRDVQAAVRYLRSTGIPRVAVGKHGWHRGPRRRGPTDRAHRGRRDALRSDRDRGLAVTPETLVAASSAKLFIAGNGDAAVANDAQRMYDLSVPPKRVEIVPSDDHGTELLEGNQGPNVRRLLSVWLAQFLPVQAPTQGDA